LAWFLARDLLLVIHPAATEKQYKDVDPAPLSGHVPYDVRQCVVEKTRRVNTEGIPHLLCSQKHICLIYLKYSTLVRHTEKSGPSGSNTVHIVSLILTREIAGKLYYKSSENMFSASQKFDILGHIPKRRLFPNRCINLS
jgi:hypothetical protein